jgi:hypothetical protein
MTKHFADDADYEYPLTDAELKARAAKQAEAEKQEPDDLTIAYMSGFHDGKKAQPKREPLTLERIDRLIPNHTSGDYTYDEVIEIIRAVEAEHDIKGGAV